MDPILRSLLIIKEDILRQLKKTFQVKLSFPITFEVYEKFKPLGRNCQKRCSKQSRGFLYQIQSHCSS